MNKKGEETNWLASKTLELIIAVICISLLVILIVRIYSTKVYGDNSEQAKALLTESDNSIQLIINSLKEGETKTRDLFKEPDGWSLFSFANYELKPNSCAGQNCLCACEEAMWDGFNGENQQKKCEKNGVCFIEEELGEFQSIKITKELKIVNITKQGGRIYLLENGI